ncbi:MAG: helix-turn-helix domain-containing protein [Holophagaceae bacterium]|nr:helix-turn-helix domain-containing protein [Holophagaceae bacterium]
MIPSAVRKLCNAFREKRLALGLESTKLAEELGFPPEIIQAVEDCDWAKIPSGQEYTLIEAMAKRLEVDLRNHPVGRSSFKSGPQREEDRPAELRRERIVTFAFLVGAVAVLAWLLIPAKDLSQPPSRDLLPPPMQQSLWQKPDSDQPYPVLGEVFPESPITNDGVLISMRATDTCNARIVAENGRRQTQVLRMSEPWKLRIKGSFTLFLGNAGVAVVEIAGQKIQHGAVVGQEWSGSFDAHGNWLRPTRRSLPRIELPDDDIDDATIGQSN